MTDITRRGFLTRTSMGLGLTLAGAAALAAPAVHAQEQEQDRPAVPTGAPPLGGAPLVEPMVVHVRDAAAGEVALLVGTRELVYRDPALVARLVQDAQRAVETEG